MDPADLLWGRQALFGLRVLSQEQQARGDVAPLVAGVPWPDSFFDAGDLWVIQRMLLEGLDFSLPANQFNIGDSIGEGEAADGTIGEAHHESVWSTGYSGTDGVDAFNERFEAAAPQAYHENTAVRDPVFNHALSGAMMAGFAAQAQNVVAPTAQVPGGTAGMITVLLGNNDVYADSLATMTDPALFEAQYRAGLDVLAASEFTRLAQVHVSGIPAIYWLWNAKRTSFFCRIFVWPFVPCQNLLADPVDDCVSSASREDPDSDYAGDGADCQRRKQFHRRIRDDYNTVLRDVLEEYRLSGALPNARYTDVFDVRFDSVHVNSSDCFHPGTAGHALLAEVEWCRTHWGATMTRHAATERGRAGVVMQVLQRAAMSIVLLACIVQPVQADPPFQHTLAGARYRDLQPGSGSAAEPGDVAAIHFTGWLEEGGRRGREVFNTRARHGPVRFVVGTDRVMPGWNEGVTGMRTGGRRLVMVPPALGYGGRGVQGVVPPGSGLVFLIELVELEKRQ